MVIQIAWALIETLLVYLSMQLFASMELGLQQRIEYLSRAAVCAKSSTSHVLAAGDGEFLHELEDKMEVSDVLQGVWIY